MRVIGHERFGVLEGVLKSGAKPLAILCIEITWVFGNWILVAKSKTPSQAACSITRLKADVRVCSGVSPRSQLIN